MVMIPPGNIPFSGLIFWPFFLYRIICSPTSLLDLIIHKHLHCNSLVYILIFRGVDPLFIRQNMVSVGIFHFKKHS